MGETLAISGDVLNAGIFRAGLHFGVSEEGFTLEEYEAARHRERQDRADRARTPADY